MPRRSITSQVGEEPVDALTRRPSRAKRDREWEREQRAAGVVTYRGIPRHLNSQIKAVADSLGVPVGDVVRAFLEYGLEHYAAGDLGLTPRLRTGRYRLFPPESD